MNHIPIIEIEEVHKTYGSLKAVDGVSFKVYRGDIFGFLGPNGAGKSTTIRMMLSLVKPTSGSIRLFGLDMSKSRKEIMSRVGAIVEKPDLYGYLSAYHNVRILSALSGFKATKEQIMEVLELVGIANRAHDKVKTFSHGMKQRVGIAQALIHQPELIILDEPTTGLDPQGMVEMRKLIRKLSEEKNITILLSSHILNEVEMLANRMVIINKGKVIVEGSVSELLSSEELKVTFEVDDVMKAKGILSKNGFSDKLEGPFENTITLILSDSEISRVNSILVNEGIGVSKVLPKRTLEEYFLNLT